MIRPASVKKTLVRLQSLIHAVNIRVGVEWEQMRHFVWKSYAKAGIELSVRQSYQLRFLPPSVLSSRRALLWSDVWYLRTIPHSRDDIAATYYGQHFKRCHLRQTRGVNLDLREAFIGFRVVYHQDTSGW
ncbi:hypothetical protein J6590_064294 [Homalodisca vitripennis]|nr:hypothetical protein J6590_064294 [Homalodisca vitripennis]